MQKPIANSLGKSPETMLRIAYNKTELCSGDFDDVISRCQELIRKVTHVPTGSVIQHYEEFSRPSFSHFNLENESKPFFDASLAVSEFVALLSLDSFKENAQKFAGQIGGKIQEDWPDCQRCPFLQVLMRAAFGLATGNYGFVEKFYTPSAISFLSKTFLLQSSLSQTDSYQIILEVFAKVFLFKAIEEQRDIIQIFIENEKQKSDEGLLFTEAPKDNKNTDFQDVLILATVIAKMYKRTDYARHFYNVSSDIISSAMEFTQPSFFATFVSFLASLAVDKEMAEEIYNRLDKSNSHLMNFPHFLEAINGYTKDFAQNQANSIKLSEEDSRALESILELASALFLHSETCRRALTSTEHDIIGCLIDLIHDQIPATLKSRCFDVLSALSNDENYIIDLWNKFWPTQILTQDQIEANSGGIITDIEKTETQERSYPLMRSFIRFLALLIHKKPPPFGFDHLHVFLTENCLMVIGGRLYGHFNEKWSILCELTQVWTNMFSFDETVYKSLMRSALCDQRFIRSLVAIITEEEAPLEALLCTFRLLNIISLHEEAFLSHVGSVDHSTLVPLSQQISWNPDCLKKLILCIGERDKDLQLHAIHLSQYVAFNSPDIAQVVFVRAKPLNTFIRVINVDEDEEGETPVRVHLLEFLVSLGSSSYFLRYIAGYNVSDPPTSLIKSNLEKGIVITILSKIESTEAVQNYTKFASIALQLMLVLCDHIFTVGPLLNLLRSTFLEGQLRALQNMNSSTTAIGCFLKLIAREATDSSHKACGTTQHVFDILMGSNDFGEKRESIVLAFVLIGRIDDSDESSLIADGLLQSCIAFISNNAVLKSMMGQHTTWTQFLLNILSKISSCTNQMTTQYLSQCAGFVSRFLFAEESFGTVSEDGATQVFSASIDVLIRMNELMHNDSMMGIFSLIASLFLKKRHSQQILSTYQTRSDILSSILISYMTNETPITCAAALAAAEGLLLLANDDSLDQLVYSAIVQLNTDWERYDEDNEPGAFILRSKFSFFIRYLSCSNLRKDIFIDNGLISLIGYAGFWKAIAESFSTSTTSSLSEIKLRTASGALRTISSLVASSPNNKMVQEEVSSFIDEFQKSFEAVISFGGFFTLDALTFISDLCFLLVLAQNCPTQLKKRLSQLRDRLIVSEKWRENIREKAGSIELPSSETISIAIKLTKKIIQVINQMKNENK